MYVFVPFTSISQVVSISIYHSQFGFVGTNPFRPKVLAAGAWFFFFTAIPISIALTFRLDSWRKIPSTPLRGTLV
jgi:hypothetical protein